MVTGGSYKKEKDPIVSLSTCRINGDKLSFTYKGACIESPLQNRDLELYRSELMGINTGLIASLVIYIKQTFMSGDLKIGFYETSAIRVSQEYHTFYSLYNILMEPLNVLLIKEFDTIFDYTLQEGTKLKLLNITSTQS